MVVVALNHTDADLVAILRARCEKSCAERDAALAALANLTNYVQRERGFMEHADQVVLREATALLREATALLLVEHGWRDE